MTHRTTVNDIAKSLRGIISPDTIRNWCDEGLLEHKRDFRGWRWFEDLDKTVKKVEELLYGND